MDWAAYYREALIYAERNITGNALFAYNVNIDAVKYLRGGERLPRRISNLLKGCVKNGKQSEVRVDKKTLRLLIDKMGYDEVRMGGQAGNMSNVASSLSVRCYTHVPSKCREQMKLFEHPENIYIADGTFKTPPKVHRRCDVPIHFVMEFRKGYRFQNVEAPASNRLIASFNPPCAVLEIDEEFKRLVPRIIGRVERALISGFHNPTLGSDFAIRIENVRKHIEELKGINPNLKVHVELGDFQHLRILKEVIRRILPVCDTVGFNEEELEQMKKVLSMKCDMWEACDKICEKFCSAVFHCNSFSFSVMREEGCADPLMFGSLLAARRAATGKNASFRELEKFSNTTRVNKDGIQQYDEFRKIKFKNNAYFAPALDIGEPKMTVGLGDCFTAGYFLTK
jgi:ADP-dependent phosphofructokinase/glucokinase